LDVRERTVTEVVPARVKKGVYQLTRRRCPQCRRVYAAQAPGVLPKCQLRNSALASIATEHYLHQVTLGHLAESLSLLTGTLIQALHHLSRAASVAKEVLGETALPGVLVVDRYHAYNKAPCVLQYCYAHLLRDVKKLGEEFPAQQEVQAFVNTAAPLLAQAIKLRTLPLTDEAFAARADFLKREIEHLVHSPAQHVGIEKIQTLFREKAHRLYHWAHHRSIPADNNFAERELRRLVIQSSFGSQADAGAKTREILMPTLLTLKKRQRGDLWLNFKTALDKLAHEPQPEAYDALFSPNSS